jgi:hypothetical protein
MNAYTIHQRRGGASLAFGLNRSDTLTGPGARDAQWLGVLARVRAGGRTRICRPVVHRRRWRSGSIDSLPFALDLRARCRGMRVAFRSLGVIPPVLWGAVGLGFYEYARPATATATGGGRGSAVVWGGHDFLP